MLSDKGSATIKRYGLLNTTVASGSREDGIPFPGTFILDRQGVVTARFFEPVYQDRVTVANIMISLGQEREQNRRSATEVKGAYLSAVTYTSDEVVAPGTTFAIVTDVKPSPNVHVYAPNQDPYIAVKVVIDESPLVKVRPAVYPEPEIYHFEPLNEFVKVYQKPFRLSQNVSLVVNADTRALSQRPDATFTIKGAIEYQACDDKVCFRPERIPVSWTLRLKPLER